jgi:feruloyl esterase
MEAQRYPDDFDGVIAMAPAFDWTGFAAEFLQNAQVLFSDMNSLDSPLLTYEHFKILGEAINETCDELDGIRDGILNDPTECHFDIETLPRCQDVDSGQPCFTEEQIEAVKILYAGIESGGKVMYPGFPFGGETNPNWGMHFIGDPEFLAKRGYPSAQSALGAQILRYFVFHDPEFDYLSYDLSNVWEDTRFIASYLDAVSTDYSAFKEKGGKVLLPHGWSDPILSALSSIKHYEALAAEDEEVDAFFKLYLIPGMLHCSGGPGPGEVDWLEILVHWVDEGKEPEKVVARKSREGEVAISRPIYPYPAKAVYDGKGDPNLESSFSSSEE